MFKFFSLVSLIGLFTAKISYKGYYHTKCEEYEKYLLNIGIDQSYLDICLFAPNTTYKDYYLHLKKLVNNIENNKQIMYVIINNYSSAVVNELLLNNDFNEMIYLAANKLKNTPLSVNESIILKEYLWN